MKQSRGHTFCQGRAEQVTAFFFAAGGKGEEGGDDDDGGVGFW